MRFLSDLIPIYPVYALLFADHGLGPAEISSLFVVWSATTFLLEVPSGAWADVVSRRALLAASAVVNGVGYAVWVAWPGYAGFLLGFVLWGLSSALASGTFEAFTYDELAAVGQERRYAQVIGWTTSAGLVGLMLSNLAAAPLILLGRHRADRLGQPGGLLRQRAGRAVAAAPPGGVPTPTTSPATPDASTRAAGCWAAGSPCSAPAPGRRRRTPSSAARWC